MTIHRLILCCALSLASVVSAHPGQHEQLARINLSMQQQPANQALYMQRGVIYSNAGQFEEAMADYAQAEALGPPILVAHDLGVLYYRMGDFERAAQYLDTYLVQFPSSAATYDYRARVARDSGDLPRAVAELDMYFTVQERPHPGNYLAAANMLQQMGKTDEALSRLDQGLEQLGLIPQLQRRAIELELQRKQPDNAIIRHESLRVPLHESPGWKLQKAELLLRVNRRSEAENLVIAATTELAELRPTPARQQLQQQAQEMLRALDTTAR